MFLFLFLWWLAALLPAASRAYLSEVSHGTVLDFHLKWAGVG
jgi:hypothetical protein